MATLRTPVFDHLHVDHIEFYVSSVDEQAGWLVDRYGFAVYAESEPAAEVRSVGLGTSGIRFVLTEPRVGDHPAAAYVDKHGDGVANIALRAVDAAAAFDEAVRRGARPVSPPARHGNVVTATIMGFGDVAHTFVQRAAGADERTLPGLSPVTEATPVAEVTATAATGSRDIGLGEVDHIAVCLEAGQLDRTVEFYETVLDFSMIFTEYIEVGVQAMNSKVVQSGSGAVTLTLIEPDVSRMPGQIDEFVKNHGGAGVQHVAFTADDIVRAVGSISAAGVEFLNTPDTYYDALPLRLDVARHPVDDLRRLHILVDADHDGQLFQIFARSTHPRRTFFFEVIERLGARTFGSGNIKALYEAVELQRARDKADE